VARLRAWGIEYNPSMLLRSLERDYGVIETSYKSSSQHWWRFIDIDAVAEALEMYEKGYNTALEAEEDVGPEDPELTLLLFQIASLNPHGVLEKLQKLASKPRLTSADYAVLRSLAFNELPAIVEVLRRAEEIGYEGEEVSTLREVLRLASELAARLLRSGRLSRAAARSLIALAQSGSKLSTSSNVPEAD